MLIAGSTSDALDLLTARMDYLKQRQAVISQNVANASAPGYKASDLVSFDKIVRGENGITPVRVAITNPAHILSSGKVGSGYPEDKKAGSYEVVPSGNSVVLEEQMVKVAEIASDFQLVSNLYKRTQNMVRTALGRI